VRHYDGRVVPGTDPLGRRHYWMTVVPLEAAEPETDRYAVEHGYVSMTPLRLDLTDHAALESARKRRPPDEVTFAAAVG
jgi:5'-nucleotidase